MKVIGKIDENVKTNENVVITDETIDDSVGNVEKTDEITVENVVINEKPVEKADEIIGKTIENVVKTEKTSRKNR